MTVWHASLAAALVITVGLLLYIVSNVARVFSETARKRDDQVPHDDVDETRGSWWREFWRALAGRAGRE
jgi:hypothetical protein